MFVSFFSLSLWILGEYRAKLKKLFHLNNRLRWGAQYPRHTEHTHYFLFSNCSNVSVTFWTEDSFCFISDCSNSFNCKPKKLRNEQIIVFYSPSNALTSSDESVQNILTSYFNWYIFPSHMVPSANTEFLLMKTHRVLNRSSKCANCALS